MLHVRLRGLHGNARAWTYADCARLVLDAVGAFAPRAVLVPAFTYSFCRTGLFHRLFSRAEAGRFAEEVRLHHARYRTPDPVFSVMDTTDWLERQEGLQFDGAFEPGCVWERFERADGWIVNLDIEVMVATHVHYCERVADVPYRGHVFFGGVVYEDEQRHGRGGLRLPRPGPGSGPRPGLAQGGGPVPGGTGCCATPRPAACGCGAFRRGSFRPQCSVPWRPMRTACCLPPPNWRATHERRSLRAHRRGRRGGVLPPHQRAGRGRLCQAHGRRQPPAYGRGTTPPPPASASAWCTACSRPRSSPPWSARVCPAGARCGTSRT